MSLFSQAWFWILLVSLILIIGGIIWHSATHSDWGIFLVVIGVLFLIFGILVAIFSELLSYSKSQTQQLTTLATSPAGQEAITKALPLLI